MHPYVDKVYSFLDSQYRAAAVASFSLKYDGRFNIGGTVAAYSVLFI